MTEFIIVLPVLLLLVLGAIQFGLVYHAKAALNLAAFEAARAGALNGGKPSAMTLGFANGLRPLFTHGTDNDAVVDGFDCARREAGYLPDNEACKNFTKIEVISPSAEAIDYWKRIPNDNLAYARDAAPTGLSLQDANILKIKVTYCYPLQIFLLRDTIITALKAAGGAGDDFTQRCYKDFRLPIVAQGIVRMQSDYCPACK